MNLIPLPAFQDNYLWLLHDGQRALVVDPGDAEPVRNFLSEGGDAQTGFKHGRDRAVLGTDIDALVELLKADPKAVERVAPGRIVRE